MAYEQVALFVALAIVLLARAIREAFARRAKQRPANPTSRPERAARDGVERAAARAPSLTRRTVYRPQKAAPQGGATSDPRQREPSPRQRLAQMMGAASDRSSPGLGGASSLRAAMRLLAILSPPKAATSRRRARG